MKVRPLAALGALVFLTINQALAQSNDPQQFNDLLEAAYSYYAASRVCGNSETVSIAKDNLIRVMNYGKFRGILSQNAKRFESDPDYYLREGEKAYRRQKWVSCAQLDVYVRDLDTITKMLP